MVLRQPMYRALRDAGHELMLIVRPSVAPLIEYVAPGAATLLLPTEVYRDDLDQHWPLFTDLFNAARAFQPDALLVAPFQWTQFEERLSDELEGLPSPVCRYGMSGRMYAGDPHLGRAPASRQTFDVTAAVDEDLPEIEKNAALAAAVLGHLPAGFQTEPRIEPGETVMHEARQVLEQIGLAPGGYWVACVTGTIHVPIKAWQLENWARLLSNWVGRHNRQFLFIGLPEEREIVEEVRRLMGDAADRTRAWMSNGAPLSQVIGLTAHSSGYAGHDTGPMHLAAALGKPVLAVFGGGHKLRFVPRCAGGAPSVIVTVGVPCTGCAWTCPFDVSHCVKDVPVDQVINAADDLEAGRVAGSQPRVLSPDDGLRDRMIREAAAFAREQLRGAGELGRQLREQQELTIRPLQAALDHRSREAESSAAKLDQQEALAAELGASVERLTKESAELTGRFAQKKMEADRFLTELAARTREAEELRRSISARDLAADRLRKQVLELERAAASVSAHGALPASRRTRFPLSPLPWRRIAIDLFTGQRHYVPRRAPRPLPKIALAMPVPSCLMCDCPDCGKGVEGSQSPSAHSCRSADIAAVRQTIESVLAQEYPRLDYILAPVGEPWGAAPPLWLEPYANRLTAMPEPSAGPFEAIAKALDTSEADVVGWLEPGDLLEPGALQNIGEHFRDHPRSAGAVFDDTADVGPWRLTRPRPRLDVSTLLNELRAGSSGRFSVFLRWRAYRRIGRLNSARGRAAAWFFLLRFSRRNGFDRSAAHVTCRRPRLPGTKLLPLHLWQSPGKTPEDALAAWQEDINAARRAFEATYGPVGRLRGWLIHRGLRVRDLARRALGRDRLVFPLEAIPSNAAIDSPANLAAPEAEAPEEPGGVSPLTGRHPVRLLFGVPAATSPWPIYHDPVADLAYTMRGAAPASSEPFPVGPFAEHRPLHVWERWLLHLPCPRPRPSSTSDPRNQSERLLSVLSRGARRNDGEISFLHAACGDGELLRQLRPAVAWDLVGTERGQQSAAKARADGIETRDIDLFDAATLIPVGRSFDVIFLDERVPRRGDLVTALRRLRQLLVPGGCIVLTGPNLRSRLLDLFGPAWPGWQINRPLTVPGRRGVARMARMADLRMTRFRTFTDTAACIRGLQQQRLGRVASPPPDPPTPEDRRRGTCLTAWANLLWDWRGKGDTFYALLE
jgi:ADP-heptose:LPS heptosyltransferase